jgi:hypothetical protein
VHAQAVIPLNHTTAEAHKKNITHAAAAMFRNDADVRTDSFSPRG